MKDALIDKSNSSVPLATACPLLGVKRTSLTHVPMSAFDPKRTLEESARSVSQMANSAILLSD